MRVAVISDIHGNAAALEAVIAEIERDGVDQIVCLGDVAVGPRPHDVVQLLRELDCRTLMGNWDEWFLDGIPEIGGEVGSRLVAQGRWWAQHLTGADRAFMRTFQRTLEVPLEASVLKS